MKKILGFLLTPIFYIYYVVMLILFHPMQLLARWIFGDKARKQTVDLLNLILVKGLYILGCKLKFSGFEKIPDNRPLIIVSNHQTMVDIPVIIHGFKKYYPRFISKIELAKNIPSISINLKYGKSALIDRKKGTQSVKEIFKLGQLIEENKQAACIFPEGTRSKTGEMKKFLSAGIGTLLRAAPSAIIVPFVIDGHSQLMYKGAFPMKFGQNISYTVLEPVEPKGQALEDLVNKVEYAIRQVLNQ